MDLGRIEVELQKLFSKSSQEDWKNIAVQEAGAENTFEKLSWRGKDGLLFLPYYDAATGVSAKSLSPASKDGGRQWLNLPLVKLQNPKQANALVLSHLVQGGEGVVYDVRDIDEPDLNTLTNNVEWEHCYLGFYLGDNPRFLASLSSLLRNKYTPSMTSGAFFWETIPKSNDFTFYFEKCPLFSALGLLIQPSSPADEVSRALMRGVRAVHAFSDAAPLRDIFRSICFSVSADATLLETIAKFKALRMLWFQIARAYGLAEYAPDQLFLHARSGFVPDGNFGPHENMIKGTFAAMAALMGGCDALTVETHETSSFAIRTARNVSSILREESFFDRDADPVGGAWAVESMTNAIAENAWELFQQKWKTHAGA